MTANEVFGRLKIDRYRETLDFEWQESERSYSGIELPFLADDFILTYAERAGLEPATAAYLCGKAIPRLKADPYLLRFMWHQHYLMYLASAPNKPVPEAFPQMEQIMGSSGYAYNLILALSGYPAAGEIHRKLGIPGEICRDTCSDLRVWCDFFRQTAKVIGISSGILSWMQLHLSGKLYRLGRLQFISGTFDANLTAYKNKITGAVLALAADGIKIDSGGWLAGEDDTGSADLWTAGLEQKGTRLIGNPVIDGRIRRRKRSISLDEWEIALEAGDPVLAIHIPAIGPLVFESCLDSIKRAVPFFTEHFPSQGSIRGFCCKSWLLDPQLRKILPDSSNIVKFQQKFHLFPIPHQSPHLSTVRHIFGDVSRYGSINEYPRTTSMQKASVKFMMNGGRFKCG
ncbi:MAG: acyltransferase domain-containing protein, partial [Victivallales bacterium]|nr:acyltransferase domain-containing protein [Victivallales bacterium]